MCGQPKVPESKPGPKKPSANDDLKSLPMPELRAKLESSPDGLSQTYMQNRSSQYVPNKVEEMKTKPFLKFLSYFRGLIPWIIEGLWEIIGAWFESGDRSCLTLYYKRGRFRDFTFLDNVKERGSDGEIVSTRGCVMITA